MTAEGEPSISSAKRPEAEQSEALFPSDQAGSGVPVVLSAQCMQLGHGYANTRHWHRYYWHPVSLSPSSRPNTPLMHTRSFCMSFAGGTLSGTGLPWSRSASFNFRQIWEVEIGHESDNLTEKLEIFLKVWRQSVPGGKVVKDRCPPTLSHSHEA